jgi:general stress protein 26
MVSLEDVKEAARALSPLAHIATVGPDGTPDVVPVHPAWEGDTLWFMCGAGSVKARNIAGHPAVAMHWQVSEVGDGVELWGTAAVFTDTDTKRRLWNGVFDYDLDLFASGGPDGSPDTAFVAVTPHRALVVKQYGMAGMDRWKA